MAIRFDRGELAKPVKQPNGWLRVDGYLTRTGVFHYLQPDGTVRRELRPPDEVFKADSLATFAMVPVTDAHPPEMLTAENTKEYSRGAVSDKVQPDGDKVRASLMVTDAELIAKMEKRDAVEVSCGYLCDLEDSPGEWQGQKYDAVQRNIRGNHVAIVERGRAGAEVRVRMDGSATLVDHTFRAGNPPGIDLVTPRQDRGTAPMNKIRIDGVDYDPSTEAFAQALAKQQEAQAAKMAELSKAASEAVAKADKAEARADAAAEQLKKAEAELKELPEKIRADMAARAELDARARAVLGKEVKLDGLSPMDVRKTVLAKLMPEFNPAGRSDAYVEARFDAALEAFDKEGGEWERDADKLDTKDPKVPERSDNGRVDADAAKAEFLKKSQNAWRLPLTASKA